MTQRAISVSRPTSTLTPTQLIASRYLKSTMRASFIRSFSQTARTAMSAVTKSDPKTYIFNHTMVCDKCPPAYGGPEHCTLEQWIDRHAVPRQGPQGVHRVLRERSRHGGEFIGLLVGQN